MMKTKIIYILISSDRDVYMEQLLVSAFSCKHFMPDANITVIADDTTKKRMESWGLLGKYVDEIFPIVFPASTPNKERSRWIKTNLRNIIDGDFLFLDTDTIVSGDLSDIDNIDFEIAMVPDLHCPSFAKHPSQELINAQIKKTFEKKIKPDSIYYNSGVILCKDTKRTRSFFNEWHKTWQEGKKKGNIVIDQRSLAVVNEQTDMIASLSGDYNCQILGSIEFLHTAKILHFFNVIWPGNSQTLSPFLKSGFYSTIKGSEYLPKETQDQILHCKSAFCSPSMIVDFDDMRMLDTSLLKLIRTLFRQHHTIFTVLNNLISSLYFFKNKLEDLVRHEWRGIKTKQQ